MILQRRHEPARHQKMIAASPYTALKSKHICSVAMYHPQLKTVLQRRHAPSALNHIVFGVSLTVMGGPLLADSNLKNTVPAIRFCMQCRHVPLCLIEQMHARTQCTRCFTTMCAMSPCILCFTKAACNVATQPLYPTTLKGVAHWLNAGKL